VFLICVWTTYHNFCIKNHTGGYEYSAPSIFAQDTCGSK
jgi:hypothetical protein